MKTKNHLNTRNVAGVLALAPYDANLAVDGNSDGSGLMVAIVKSKNGMWTLPKGAIEEGEDFENAALRELAEETGINLGRAALLLETRNRYSREGKTAHHIIDYCFAYIDKPEPLISNENDVVDAAWVSLDGLLKMLSHPEAKEAIETHLQQYGLLIDEPTEQSYSHSHSGGKGHQHHHKKH